jgi:predicted Zn-dependent peptidase
MQRYLKRVKELTNHWRTALSNGTNVLLKYDPRFSYAAVYVAIRGGSAYEHDGKAGAAHFAEHLFFKQRDEKELLRDFKRYTGNTLYAYTGMEELFFSGFSVMPEYLDNVLRIVARVLSNREIDIKTFENERNVIIKETSRYNPDLSHHYVYGKMFGDGHPYTRETCGTVDNVQRLTPADIQYARSFFGGNNLYISVVGSFDESAVLLTLEECLGGLESNSLPEVPSCDFPLEPEYTHKKLRNLKFNTTLSLCYKAPGINDPDVFYIRRLLSYLSGGMESVLFETLRNKRGLCYGIENGDLFYSASGGFSIDVRDFDFEKKDRIISLVDDEIERIKDGIIDKDLFDVVREGYFMRSMKDDENVGIFSQGIVQRSLFGMESLCGFYERLCSMTPEDLQIAAQKYLTGRRIALALQRE